MLQHRNSSLGIVLETNRLTLCRLTPDDAAFILELVNDPLWLMFIGDKGVRTLEDARKYILDGPMDSYRRVGYGLYLTKLKSSDTPIGICGLLKRESLVDVDVGFAFLPAYRKKGYAFESAFAVLNYARTVLGISRIVALTAPDNQNTICLLEKLGLRFDKMIKLSSRERELKLFAPVSL